MKYLPLLIIFSLFPFSCNTQEIIAADTVDIVFYGRTKGGALRRPLTVTDRKKVLLFSKSFAGTESAPLYKCGYTGSIIFYRSGKKILSTEFNLSEECAHFVSMEGEKLISRKIRTEGLKLLRDMYKDTIPEKNWLLR
jgi:hypothetical protein